ncbi:ABC transporter substrate-binding protein [Brevibacillus centrosporus]|uniref:ABC transporter substrate-binding protein n=1 Tax=Brevibacillus centrosporus TaxID=54910 RepID=UPI000F0A5836|nr:ABC transporter substrate-binding protein [Brevibacillus centrosporus]MEC2129638.1 ABC transporter substrate-binding protein [Brevibacillus centrosporus]MED4909066.1 ABC transporter substrate-binding protein [Brevibacillus centrosporus]RNB65761.1 ABC transporter substrate-binding protein [Brevibacillus centrosporus]GED29997.1 peptide ABC transporter [Brevibacillus centrosporus]
MRLTRTKQVVCSLLLVTSLLAGCGKESAAPAPASGTPGTEAKASGGEFIFGLASEPTVLDPGVEPSAAGYRVFRQIFDSLVVETADHSFKPWLATSWEISPDAKQFTFHLRKDVKFHDGTPFNAEAVKFNFDRIVDPKTKSRFAVSLIGPYDSSEVIDEYTIRVNFKQPHAPFMEALSQAFLGMASPTAVKKFGDKFGQNPVGTGPFVFEKWIQKSEIALNKNPDYNWAPETAGHTGAAYLDKLIYRIIPEDSTRVGSVQSGQIAAAETIPPQNIVAFKNDSNIQMLEAQSPGSPYTLMLNTTKQPWDDVKVRTAVMLAIDMDTIVKTLYMGTYQRAWGPLTPSTAGYDPKVENSWKPDTAKANQLLDEAGWTERDANGTRMKNGQPLVMNYLIGTPNREKRHDIGTMMQQQLKQIGISVKIDLQATNAVVSAIMNGQYDMTGTSLVQGDPDVLRSIYHSINTPTPQKFAFNLGHLENQEIDQLLMDGLKSTDLKVRSDIYAKVQEYLIENALTLPTYVFPYTVAAQKEFTGIQFDSRAYPLFYDVAKTQ